MRIGIAAKLNLLVICMVAMLGFFLSWFFIRHETTSLISEYDKRVEAISRNFAYNCEYGILVGDKDGLRRLIAGVKNEEDIIYVSVKDKSGRILVQWSAGPDAAGGNTREFIKSVISKTVRHEPGEYVDVFEEQPEIEEIVGSVRLGFTLSARDRQIRQVRSVVMLFVSFATVLSTILAYGVIRIFIGHTLVPLVDGIKKFAAGDLRHRVVMKGSDELAELGALFNSMAENLSATLVSREFVVNIIDSMMNCLIVVNGQGVIMMVNNAVCDLLGYKKSELDGKTADVIFDKAVINECPAGKKSGVNCETVFVTRSGKRIPMLFSSSVMADEKGTARGVVCAAQDISERKRAENALRIYNEQLKRSNQNLEDFAYIASHDLQEPLRKVKAFSDFIKTKYESVLDEKGLDYISRMQSATGRMQALIDSLLTYSRVATKAQPFALVDLNVTLQGVITDLEMRIRDTGGRVDAGQLPSLEADHVQMQQLFQNLIGNALKFHRKDVPPVVKIYNQPVGADEGYCRIVVEDNGIGFEEKYAEKIFAIFQRLHGREEYEGTGVGLAICRKIMDRHYGSIVARSVPGEGTKFIFTLPLKQKKGEKDYAAGDEKINNNSDGG